MSPLFSSELEGIWFKGWNPFSLHWCLYVWVGLCVQSYKIKTCHSLCDVFIITKISYALFEGKGFVGEKKVPFFCLLLSLSKSLTIFFLCLSNPMVGRERAEKCFSEGNNKSFWWFSLSLLPSPHKDVWIASAVLCCSVLHCTFWRGAESLGGWGRAQVSLSRSRLSVVRAWTCLAVGWWRASCRCWLKTERRWPPASGTYWCPWSMWWRWRVTGRRCARVRSNRRAPGRGRRRPETGRRWWERGSSTQGMGWRC